MMTFAFYLFALSVVVSGFMVVISRNPVHSVLWLILAFISAAGLFVLQGAEFVAMLLVIVYVGAVAVLFLFVVMMLDVDFAQLRQGFQRYLPVGGLIGAILGEVVEGRLGAARALAVDLRDQRVQHADLVAAPQQLVRDEAADEPCTSGDQNLFHLVPPSVSWKLKQSQCRDVKAFMRHGFHLLLHLCCLTWFFRHSGGLAWAF